jgi:uncharacterized repeat protein (TIGR01451 family)
VCTYNAALDANAFASQITVRVTLDAAFLGTQVVNVATAIAVVDPPLPRIAAARAQALLVEAAASDPGTVVTATDTATTVIVRESNLAIDKSVSATTAAPTEIFDWVLKVTNNGPDTAVNVVVSDAIPAAFEVVGTFPAAELRCTNSANAVQCTAASLANGGVLSTTIQVRVLTTTVPGTVINTATVATDSTDNVPTDNSDSASITIVAPRTPANASSPPTVPAGPASGGPTLPRTGNSSLGAPLRLAALLLVGGIFSLLIARRRRIIAAG